MRKRSQLAQPQPLYAVAGFLCLVIAIFSVGISSTSQNMAGGENVALAKSANISGSRVDLGLPARLVIPKIRVNAKIEQVGLTPQGAVGVPKGPTNVAWFNRGPLPGAKGTAIIDGHFGYWQNGVQTVFNNLYRLKKGDKVSTLDGRGKVTTFVVRELRVYGPDDDVSDVFASSDGEAHLNLVTCEGSWDKISKAYSNRLVVFTDKEVV